GLLRMEVPDDEGYGGVAPADRRQGLHAVLRQVLLGDGDARNAEGLTWRYDAACASYLRSFSSSPSRSPRMRSRITRCKAGGRAARRRSSITAFTAKGRSSPSSTPG